MNKPPPLKYKIAAALGCLLVVFFAGSVSAQLSITTANEQGVLPFTPDWTPANNSLIANLAPSSSAGNFSLDVSGRSVNSLTAGGSLTIAQLPGNNTSTNYITCGDGSSAGSLVIYSLPASTNGYNLTNITVYGGWKDNGRDAQAYTVYYSTAASPAAFTLLTQVNYNPSVPASTASATRVVIAGSGGGLIASNVAAVKFDFTSPAAEHGYTGYAAITVQGTNALSPSGPPIANVPGESPANANVGVAPGTTVTLTAAATGSMPIGYKWQTDGGSGGALTNIPGANSSTLVVNTTGFSYGTYQYNYVATNSLGTNISPTAVIAVVAMVDIGSGTPAIGADDISQLLNTAQADDGINYYTDNGPAYSHWCGQTFTTGTNQQGYILKTMAWKSAGNGNNFGASLLYHLYVYSISADESTATVIASYQGYGGGIENDWFQWRGLSVPLAPNRLYGYAFGRDNSVSGWEHIGSQGGNSYTGGKLMSVANITGTGPVAYGLNGNSDATFNLGMAVYTQPAAKALVPTCTPNINPIYAGTPVTITLNETVLGTAPFTYQWLTDNGTGGALVPINGATSTNLLVDIASLAAGNYRYAVTVNNAYGASTSMALTLNILGATAPSITTDIAPSPANVGSIGQTLTYSATFTGTPPINYQWYINTGKGPAPISAAGNPSAISNVLVIDNLQMTNAGIYSLTAQNSSGSASSSGSTLIVIPPAGAQSLPVTFPPVTLDITQNGSAGANLGWSQGALLQSTNISGPWTAVAATLEASNYPVVMTNAAMFYKVAIASEPRIVNIYNFIRDQDFRVANSQQVLFNATTQQVQLLKQANLPATWALQYDALIDTNYNYQGYLKQQLGTNDEIAAWWEIPQALVEKAGLVWRGQHEWDPAANVGFSPGYTPAERRLLVDVYMADFKAIFGYYPRSVGSWYIDEVTLAYMADQYGIVASCNCKDQVGTDGYTLWGSYWNQAYYPSLLNAYMPAQTRAGQINVPIFRMLGSDPIYQHGTTPGLFSLEPVYPDSGGSANWVAWFMNNLITQPSLAFGYTQAGQENAFGWDAMNVGLTRQIALFAAQSQAGEIQVQTLAQAGRWFREHYSLTPPTSVVALDDWKKQGRKTVWYNSRFFRLNILWQNGVFFIRDLHRFDENVISSTHTNPLTATSLAYYTLPIMDGALWSGTGTNPVGMWPFLISSNGATSIMTPQGLPLVKEVSPTDLSIRQPLDGGGVFSVICSETNVTCLGLDGQGQPLPWVWDLVGGTQQQSAVQLVNSNGISYHYAGADYQLQLSPGTGSSQQLGNGTIRLSPNSSGKLVLILGGF